MPLVSIIIPAFNSENTVKETIESVLNQTWTDWEIILVNDGSQDSTLEIVNNINDNRLKIFTYSNGGANASRNRGLSHASGEFVSFLDADDLWTPDKLESQFKALQENPEAAVAYSWTNSIDETGNFLRRGSYITANGDIYTKLLLIDFIESGSNPLIRRAALANVGDFDESLAAAQDWDMWLRLAAQYHFVAVSSVQILYRVSNNSMSANILRQEAASLQVIEKSFSNAPQSLQYLKKYSIGNRYKCLTFMALQRNPSRKQGIIAMKLLIYTIKNDPSLLMAKALLKVFFKIVVMIIFSPEQTQYLITKLNRLLNIESFLGYIKLEVLSINSNSL
ncbi:MAG TPA: glycosyl transferase family A [Cyanobacteria bacterium UBA11149]|nr:glycosyl transferase family A [Cyanobacteria bacterium UBA11367]HBE59678.1 glycosyl transferase family A [Cyanobacteria bacterium UBA11366]HBK64970.1 glycosyl transferase family A [Cyanobacteria bacterium UBA11166]HBR75909.1 glycosyl transferase family A [Cyanobacteria bacterium UBA11159]HBS68071.1 glycosyl transferase family A [Cyanobacteria bacterium UBA11153]HBW88036.1 glycosyl transferase family A [Cyanobacteria bacterium UBA11149]HCA95770.1 glycosyl transferase family A [Cyanobacteria